MMNRMLTAASAAAFSLALAAGALSAQELGVQQLQDTAVKNLSQLGMDTSVVPSLTLEELTEVNAAASTGGDDKAKMDQIGTIIRDAEERIAAGGATTPVATTGDVTGGQLDSMMVVKEQVSQELAQLGLTEQIDVDTLTDEQLIRIQLVTASEAGAENKRQQVELIATQ